MIFKAMMAMKRAGLNDETSGNASIRHANGFYISRTGPITKSKPIFIGTEHPQASCEWRMHLQIYRELMGVNAIIHFHGLPLDKDPIIDNPAQEASQQLANQVGDAFHRLNTDTVFLKGHGNVVVGYSMETLIERVESGEFKQKKSR